MRSRQSWRQATLAVVLLGLNNTVSAQVKFPVTAPTAEVGEVAKYRVIDMWNGSELRTSELELVDVQGDQFVVRVTSPAGAVPRTAYFNKQWQPCRTLQNSDRAVCTGSFHFPMQVGNKYKYEQLPWPNGQGHSSANCEVVGEEKVIVPAGSFDAVKIECSGFWNRVFGGTFNGRQKETAWYAPSLSRMVKSEFVNYNSSGKLDTRELTELTEFKAKAR